MTAYGFDVETRGLNPWAPGAGVVCGSLCSQPGSSVSWVIWTDKYPDTAQADVARVIRDNPNNTIIGHNLGFDLAWVAEPRAQIFDTMIAQYRLDENAPASLEAVAQRWLGKGKMPVPATGFDQLTPELVEYNKEDSRLALELYPILRDELQKQGLWSVFERDMKLLKVLVRMKRRGVLVDWNLLEQKRDEMAEEAREALAQLHALVGRQVSPRSPKQMTHLLYEELALPVVHRTKKGAPSTDREALSLVSAWATPEQQEVLSAIKRYRVADKLGSGFAKKLPNEKGIDGRLHTTFNLGRGGKHDDAEEGTRTGRLSSSNPNLQNLPKRDNRVRQCIVPSAGRAFLRADYSQVELRIAAWLSADPVMRQIFERGEDFHTATLAKLERVSYETAKAAVKESPAWKTKRDACKRVNFGSIYGGYPNTIWKKAIADDFDIPKALIENIWHEQKRIFSYFWAWSEVVGDMAVRDEYVLSPLNVRRRFPGLTKEEDYGTLSHARRQAVNHLIQNTAAEIMLNAIIDLEESLPRDQAALLLTIHDEVLIEYDLALDAPALCESVRSTMQDRAMERLRAARLPDLEHLNLIVETSAPHMAWAA